MYLIFNIVRVNIIDRHFRTCALSTSNDNNNKTKIITSQTESPSFQLKKKKPLIMKTKTNFLPARNTHIFRNMNFNSLLRTLASWVILIIMLLIVYYFHIFIYFLLHFILSFIRLNDNNARVLNKIKNHSIWSTAIKW